MKLPILFLQIYETNEPISFEATVGTEIYEKIGADLSNSFCPIKDRDCILDTVTNFIRMII